MNMMAPMIDDDRGFAPVDDHDPLYREMPNNVEAEQGLLGACLVNNDAFHLVAPFLMPEHFFEPLHRDTFATISEMISRGKIANPITVKSFMPEHDKVGDITVGLYLARLASEATTIINAADFGRLIYDLALRRSLIRIGEEMVNVAFDAPLDAEPETQMADVEERISALRMATPTADGNTDDVSASMDFLMASMSSPKKAAAASIPVPLPEIGDILQEPGLTPGNLYGLLGASGEGKTSLMLQFATAACEAGHPVLILSFDQSKDQVLRQMWSQASGISVGQMMRNDPGRTERLRAGDWKLLCDARDRMRSFELGIHRLSNMRVSGVTATAKRWVNATRKRFDKKGLMMPAPLVIVDHVSAVTPEDRRADSGTIASSINRPCKAIAEELGVAWLSLNQRNGQGNGRDVPRPIASDLYGGEASRMDYDAILYLYRPERWRDMALRTAKDGKQEEEVRNRFMLRKTWKDAGIDPEGKAELGAIKVRYGDANISEFVEFEGRYTRYASLRREAEGLF